MAGENKAATEAGQEAIVLLSNSINRLADAMHRIADVYEQPDIDDEEAPPAVDLAGEPIIL